MNKKHRIETAILGIVISLPFSVKAAGHEHVGHDHSRVDAHAPIGVMGDHLMAKGEWMASYRFMRMHMDGMLSGSDDISPDTIATTANPLGGETMRMGYLPDGSPRLMTVPGTYRISPLEMDMDMHMLGIMYGISDDITATVMFSYIEKEMTSITYQGMMGTTVAGQFTGKTSGVGDTKVSALIKLDSEGIHNFHLNAGVSLPTGSITESGSVLPPFAGLMTPAGELVSIDRLGYNMQLGSGTVDLVPGVTYTAHDSDLSWGAQVLATLRLYDNDEDYRLGNVYEGTAWVARQWQPWVSTSVRMSAKSEGSIKGRDLTIKGGATVANPANSGRDELDLFFGANFLGKEGWVKNQRIAIEVGVPVYEKVDGIQMSHDWTATIGWQTTF